MVFQEAARARSLARRGRERQRGKVLQEKGLQEKVLQEETPVVGQESTEEQESAVRQELQGTEAIKKLHLAGASEEVQEAGTGRELQESGAGNELQDSGEVKQLQEAGAGEDRYMAGAGKELQVAGGGSKVQEVEAMKEDSTGSSQGSTTANMDKLVEIQSSPKKRGRKRKVAPTLREDCNGTQEVHDDSDEGCDDSQKASGDSRGAATDPGEAGGKDVALPGR